MEELEANRRREENAIFLHKLPKLARKEVIRSMIRKECIRLAVTSKRMEECVRSVKIPISKMTISLKSKSSRIVLGDHFITLFCTTDVPQLKKGDVLGKTELEPWMNKEPCTEVENIAAVFKRIQNLFLFKRINLYIGSDFTMTTTFKELLLILDIKKWNYLTWMPKQINLDDWNYIMDGANLNQGFYIHSEIPPNFKHENAFKYLDSEYNDARWVQIEDLFSLKNCENVRLLENHFTGEHLRRLIKHWANSDVDMFYWLCIGTSEQMEVNQLLRGHLVLEHTVNQTSPIYFVLSKYSITRRKRVLCIRIGPKSLLLTAWAPDEPFLGADGGRYGKEYNILALLNIKKILNDTLRRNRLTMEDLQKEEIKAEIDELKEKVRELGARYRRGMWRIRT